jgi:hypothetical protein
MFKSNKALAAAAAALLATGVSAPAMAGDERDILRGAVVGAAGGAVVGAVVPGVSTGKGALVGGLGGAAVGALKKNKRYYTDSYGRRYWVDSNGRRRYG